MNTLVSGGSRGLGLAVVERLLKSGEKVASFARNATPDMARLATLHGDALEFRELDACDYDGIALLIADCEAAWGGLDVLVNNAAIGQDSLLAHTSVEEIGRITRVNIEAPIVLSRLMCRSFLRSRRPGHIIMLGSICGTKGYAGLTAYSASKGAAEAFARSLAQEMKGRARVNTVAPGFFSSEMSSSLAEGQLATIERRTPSGRLTSVEEVADVVCWLVGGDRNINGATITIDGGASS